MEPEAQAGGSGERSPLEEFTERVRPELEAVGRGREVSWKCGALDHPGLARFIPFIWKELRRLEERAQASSEKDRGHRRKATCYTPRLL